MTKDFWFGKRVLVTGGDGFVASNLVESLLDKGANVTVTVRHKRPIVTRDLICDAAKGCPGPDIEQSDLLDLSEILRIHDRHQFDTIFHLAASAIVSDAANAPYSTIENNVMSTLNILETARRNKISRVLIVSTDKSYGDHAGDQVEPLPYRENYALRGLDAYSASKVCSDILGQTYAYQFKVPVLVARSCNIFGPGDLNFTRLMPRTIMRLMAGLPPIINQGNEKVLREYIYVSDVVKAYMLMMEKIADYYGPDNCNMPKSGKETYGWAAFSVGSYTKADMEDPKKCAKIKNVEDVIQILRTKVADVNPLVVEKPANFIELSDQFIDAGKIMKLGFKPEVGFEEGLDKTIAWYKNNFTYLEKLVNQPYL